jgi:DNA primase
MLETSNPQAITPDVRDSLAELQAFTGKAEEEAAFLVAAILDPTSGMDQAAMAAPQRAAVAELRDALNRAGLMAPCTLSGGRVGIWGDL